MNPPTISVIISCYNYGRFLKEAIESVLNQTYQDFEIIVVDDHSTDRTAEVMAEYINNPKISYIQHDAHVGQVWNKNSGIELAKGEFIAFLDADDAYYPRKLEKQVEILRQCPQYDVTYCMGNQFDETLTNIVRTPNIKNLKAGWVTEDLFINCFTQGMTFMIRSRLLKEIGGFPSDANTFGLGSDWAMMLELSTRTPFFGLNEPLYKYRLHGSQVSKNVKNRIQSDKAVRKIFLKKHPKSVSFKTRYKVWQQVNLSKGFYYRVSGQFITSTLCYIMFIIKNPLSSLGYKGALLSLLGFRGSASH